MSEDHQTKNAKAILDKNGCIMLKESELDEQFKTTFADLISNDELQDKLSKKIHKLALPYATREIVNEIEKLV